MSKDDMIKRLRKYMWMDALVMITAMAVLIVYIIVFHFITRHFEIPTLGKTIITAAFIGCVFGVMNVTRKKVRKHFVGDIDFLQEKNYSEK